MKLSRSLKFRFILLFTVFIVAVCGVISFLGVRQVVFVATDIFTDQGVFLVEKAASYVDGDSFEALARSLDADDPFYEETRLALFELKQLFNCQYLYTMAPAEGAYWQYIIDGSAPPDDEENFSALGSREDTADYDPAFRRVQRSKKTEASYMMFQEGWGWIISIYAPILNSSGDLVGIAGCDFDAERLHGFIVSDIIRQVIIGGAAMLLGLGLVIFFLRMIFTRLHNVNLILKEISTGDGDLTKRIKMSREDEIGELATNFNLSLDKIRNLVVVIKDHAGNLFNIGNDLAANMEQTSGAISHITDNIMSIKEKVANQSSSVTQTNAAMEQVTVNIDRLNGNVESQSASVSQSSSAIEEMLANVQSVTQTLIRNAENVRELIDVSDAGRNGLQGVSRDIQEIARESEGLLEINSVMQNIASQTNLLSMNAAIEAAHAGEAGKGFAVVADEIRKLAENAGRQSKTISEVLKKIKSAIDTITVSTNSVLENFQAIEDHVKTVSGQESNIRGAMEEQGQGSKQILEAISQLNDITRMVKEGSTEMLDGSREVIQESKNLEMATERISTEIGAMAGDADQINSAVGRVQEISNQNREHINTLFEEVSKFKID